jgi:HTH-type transcriptional regulator/antitoxin HigA
MMDIRPIKTEADYDWALREIGQYFDNEPALGSKAAARFDVLTALIESYEARVWPIEAPDPIDAIREVMEHRHLKQSDFAALIGSRSRASEILSRKRQLTMEQAWKLHREWHIPAESLLRPVGSGTAA